MAESLLELRHLRKAYGALVVTDDVSLSVQPGELHAIIGPNGAGKTTLIHQISGTLRSDSGSILFAGEDVTSLSMPQRVGRGLARSFQITSILPGFLALENVALAVQARTGSSFRFLGNASQEKALNGPAMDCLQQVGLEARAYVPAGLLSHGEKRQLELAIGLADECLGATRQRRSPHSRSLGTCFHWGMSQYLIIDGTAIQQGGNPSKNSFAHGTFKRRVFTLAEG